MWARLGRPVLACSLRIGRHYSRSISIAVTRNNPVYPSSLTLQQQGFKTSSSSQSHVAGVSEVQLHPNHLSLDVDGQYLQVNYTWLRDHCKCSECYNYATSQKNILVHRLDEIHVKEAKVAGENLEATFTDGHHTSISLELLLDASFLLQRQKGSEKFLWKADRLAQIEFPDIKYKDFLQNDKPLKDLLQSLLTYGIGFVKDVPPTKEGTQDVVERVSFVQQTHYGGMWSFTSEGKHDDTAYSTIALGAHTDNTYFSVPTGIQVFHCVAHRDGTGGETLLLDGFRAAEDLRKDDPAAFDLLTQVRVPAEYKEGQHGGVDVRSLNPILKVHPVTEDLEWIRYNHYDRGFLNTIPPQHVAPFYKALASLSERIEEPAREFWTKLKPGTVLFIDNWRVMHGRASFTGHREIHGCYLPRDDWLSKARILGLL